MTPATTDGQDKPSVRRTLAGTPTEDPIRSRALRLRAMLGGAACVLLAIYLVVSAHQASIVADAEELSAAGRPEEAIVRSRQVTGFPAAARAQLIEAYALDQSGRYKAAVDAYERAVQREPESWIVHRDLAVALAHAGDAERARTEMSRALALNPGMDLPPLFPPPPPPPPAP